MSYFFIISFMGQFVKLQTIPLKHQPIITIWIYDYKKLIAVDRPIKIHIYM